MHDATVADQGVSPTPVSGSSGVPLSGALRQQRSWWAYPLWRESKTIFFSPAPYRVISFFRRWTYDILAIMPLAAAAVWWVTVSSGTDVAVNSVSTPDSLQVFLLSHHVARFYPTLIAFVLCVLILRTGRTTTPRRRSRSKASLTARMPLALVVFLLVLAVADLILVPGSIAERAAPCVVAAAYGWLIRSQVYGRVRVLEATDAGFRPPARIALRRRSRRFAKKCLTSAWHYQNLAAERSGLNEAITFFAGRVDARTLAWCLARAIDYNLRASALDEAEAVLDRLPVDDGRQADHAGAKADRGRLDGYPALASDPCVRAARGLFERATGSSDAKATFADAEDLCGKSRRRVPYRLRTLQQELEKTPTGEARRWSARARASLTWSRQYAVVLQDVLTASVPLEQRNPQAAWALAGRVGRLVDDLGKESARSDLTVQEAARLVLVKGAAYERGAELLAGQRRFQEAAAGYARAVACYRAARYRPGAGLAATRAALLALRAGVTQGVKEEADLLTALLTGLQEIEFDRGRLESDKYRASLLQARDATYTEVFEVLAEHVTANRDKAAEIALWLLESVHRNALAERIRAKGTGATGAEEEALRRLREPADIAGIRRVVTGRAALYYRCEPTGSGWQVTTVLVAPSGITLHRSFLSATEPGSIAKVPALLLNALQAGTPPDDAPSQALNVPYVHNFVRLGAPVWQELARAILPPGLASVLRSLQSPEGPAVLLVVPDGPLSSVPFAGLRLADGSAVVDHAAVVFMPNLLAFSVGEWDSAPAGDCVVVAHFGPTRFRDAFESQRADPYFGLAEMKVRAAPDLDSFVSALTQAPAPRIAVISHHGYTAASRADWYITFEGGGRLSEQDAEHVSWPQTVILGSCSVGNITVRAGDNPVGLPTACLLGGARAVLGGQSQVDNDTTSAAILARVTLEATDGQHPALALRAAMLDHLVARPADRDMPSAQWANLIVWTSQAPAGFRPVAPRWDSWTTELTARPPGEDRFAAFSMAVLTKNPEDRRTTRSLSVPLGQALRRVVEHAPRTGPYGRLTTLDLLAAIYAAEGNADWTSFAVGADLPALPKPEGPRYAGQETDDTNSALRLSTDRQVPVTEMVLDALEWAERLASYLNDPAVTPAHLVYGFLCLENSDAAHWMARGGHPVPELRALLSDRVFSIDLPAPSELPALKTKPPSANLVRPVTRKRQNPRTSQEVLGLIAASDRGVLSTLDFVRATAAANGPAWRALANAGFGLTPPDGPSAREHDRGGQEIPLGQGYVAVGTRELADAVTRARALAWHLGNPEILPQHVLYGILANADSDAARWLRPVRSPDAPDAPASTSALQALAERAFGGPLPAARRLPAAPKPPDRMPTGLRLVGMVLLVWLVLLLEKPTKKIREQAQAWLFMAPFLVILIVTMGLADINTAPENSVQLTAERSMLTGTVTLAGTTDGSPVPATLIGGLSAFYATPAVSGWSTLIHDMIFHNLGNTPGSLSGWYLFALPAPAHAPAAVTGTLTYRGSRYPAQVTCQGLVDDLLCFAAVKLPAGANPGGFAWGDESLSDVPAQTRMTYTAVVYQGSSQAPTVGAADIQVYFEDSAGDDLIEVAAQSGQPIVPGSPVVLNDRSRTMPLYGIAVPAKSGSWDDVYPISLLNLYGQGIADKIAGPIPGAMPYAGVDLSGSSASGVPSPALVTGVVLGSPADAAGIVQNDEIVAINGQPVDGPAGVTSALSGCHIGQTATFEILRKQGDRYVHRTLSITLGYRPV
jgi:hypothetical protein